MRRDEEVLMKTATFLDARRLVEQEPELTVIEVLPEELYEEVHLPGAKCVPLDGQFEQNVRQAAPDPTKPVMVYAMDQTDRSAERAAQRMERLGYRDVHVFVDGKIGWMENGLPTE
jgi:rhodanese-related sulfurtransferase